MFNCILNIFINQDFHQITTFPHLLMALVPTAYTFLVRWLLVTLCRFPGVKRVTWLWFPGRGMLDCFKNPKCAPWGSAATAIWRGSLTQSRGMRPEIFGCRLHPPPNAHVPRNRFFGLKTDTTSHIWKVLLDTNVIIVNTRTPIVDNIVLWHLQ